MSDLLLLEFKKLKRTFLIVLLPAGLLVPVILALVQFGFNEKNMFNQVVSKSSVFIQMISFACVVISGCFIISREYKNNLISYLAITPKSMVKVLISKYIVLFIETGVLQIMIFGVLALINTLLYGFDSSLTGTYLTAGILSTLCLFCLVPVIVCIALVKRNMASSALVFLFLYMLTFPFSFMSYGYLFPHLLPVMLISKYLGNYQYAQINYISGALMLTAVFISFLILSLYKIRKKE